MNRNIIHILKGSKQAKTSTIFIIILLGIYYIIILRVMKHV